MFAFWSLKCCCTLKAKRNFQEWKYRQLTFQRIFCFYSVVTVWPTAQFFAMIFFSKFLSPKPFVLSCRSGFSEGKHFLSFGVRTDIVKSATSAWLKKAVILHWNSLLFPVWRTISHRRTNRRLWSKQDTFHLLSRHLHSHWKKSFLVVKLWKFNSVDKNVNFKLKLSVRNQYCQYHC